MEWSEVVKSSLELPYYIRRGDSLRGEPIAVISEDGLSLGEPYYDRIVPWIDGMIAVLGIDSVAVNNHSISEVVGEISMRFIHAGLVISIPVSFIILLIALRVKDLLAKNIYIKASETIHVGDRAEVIDQLIDSG